MAEGRSGPGQAVAQVATLAITTAISGLGGLVTGLLMRAVGRAQFRGDRNTRGSMITTLFSCQNRIRERPEISRFDLPSPTHHIYFEK